MTDRVRVSVPGPEVEADLEPGDVERYLAAHGWRPIGSGLHTNGPDVVGPVADSAFRLRVAIAGLAEAEGRRPHEVLADVVATNAARPGRCPCGCGLPALEAIS